MDKLSMFLKDISEQLINEESIIDQYCRYEGREPIDAIIEKEERTEIVKVIEFLNKNMTESERMILYLYTVEGKNQQEIADIVGLSQKTISKKLDSFPVKFSKLLFTDASFDNFNIENSISVHEKEFVAHKPTPMGMPFEYFRSVNNGGRWGKKYGKKIWVSKEKCLLPEYFKSSFKDSKTVCTLDTSDRMCSKCTRKSS